jgi:hypothetical protein
LEASIYYDFYIRKYCSLIDHVATSIEEYW